MLKKQILILFLLETNCLFPMQQYDLEQKISSPNFDINNQLHADQNAYHSHSLVAQCSKSISNFLLDSKKFPDFKIELNKLPEELKKKY